MGIALLSAERSKDPSTQVGACIASKNNKIVGVGYNGFPVSKDCFQFGSLNVRMDPDEILPWVRETENNDLGSKYLYVVHAEINAIMNSIKDLKGCRLYVTLFPCNECAKVIIQSGIEEIIFLTYGEKEDTISVRASKLLLETCGIHFRKYSSKNKKYKILL